jgi:hypothetical protein
MDRKKETQKRMLEFMEWARNSPPSNPARSGPHREFKPDPVISGLPKGKFVPWEILKTPKFKPVDLFDCRSAPPEQPAQSLADDDNSKSQ